MKKRVLGAFIVLFLLILSLIIGSYAFNLLMCLCALLSFIELFNIRYDNKKDIMVMKLFGIFSLLFSELIIPFKMLIDYFIFWLIDKN